MASAGSQVPRIYVLAGTNGSGKSSIGGAMFLEQGAEYVNPDEEARRIRAANPDLTQPQAQSAAWHQTKRLLERAIVLRRDYAFETTFGGNTIPALIKTALSAGIEVCIWYVGLASAELNIARVRLRVSHGGHDIPEDKIRERYVRSIQNLLQVLPQLTELRVYDNSYQADPYTGDAPEPRLIVHFTQGKIVTICDPASIPHWAIPIVTKASA